MQRAKIQWSVLRRRNRGVTLIEAMVVVVIIAILAGIAAPDLRRMFEDLRVSNATNEFTSAINLARTEAIKKGRLVTICRSANAESDAPSCSAGSDWNVGWLVFVESSSTANVSTYEAGEDLLARRGLFTGGITAQMTTANAWMTFNSTGEPVGMANMAINFNYEGKHARQICMSRSGRVRVIKDAVAC